MRSDTKRLTPSLIFLSQHARTGKRLAENQKASPQHSQRLQSRRMNQGSRRSFGIIVAAFCLMAVALGVVLFHNSSRKPEPQTDSSAGQAAPAAPETESNAPHTST